MRIPTGQQKILAAVLFGTFGSIAYGQAGPASGVTDKSNQLTEIVVTAQRRTESLQQTPVAVTAFSATELQDRDVRNIQDLVTATPNLEITSLTPSSGSGSAVFFLRGLGQQRGGNGSQPAVGIYLDDYYFPSLAGSLLRVLDVSEIEVLRGPQGTLFGRNTIGGAVRYTSVVPNQVFGGHIEATNGDYSRRDYSGSVNIPVNDILAFRVAAASLSQDGYIKNQNTGKSVGDTRDIIQRLQARLTPTDKLTWDLTAESVSSKLVGYAYVIPTIYTGPGSLAFFWNTSTGPATGRNPALPAYDSTYASTCKYCQYGEPNEFFNSRITDYRSTVTWNPTENLVFKSLTGYFDIRNSSATGLDHSPVPLLDVSSNASTKAFSQEFQLGGSALSERLNWTSGIYYFRSTDKDARNSVNFGTVGDPTFGDYQVKALAAYLQASYALTDKFTATLGGRDSKEEARTNPTQTVTAGFGPGAVKTVLSPVATSSNRNFSPMGKLQYQWTPTIMTYASVSRGFRAGGLNQFVGSLGPAQNYGLFPFDPETVTSYELGARTEFLDHRLQLNATVFDGKYTKIQTTRPQALTVPPFITTIIENAGKGEMSGLELEARAVINRLRLHASLATLRAHYNDIGNSGSITLNSNFARAPKLTYSVGGSYDLPLVSGALQFNLDWGWQATQNSTPTDVPVVAGQPAEAQRLPSYGLLNGRVAYTFADKRWNLALSARNMLNKYYYTGGANFADIGPNYYEVGAPRQYALTLQYTF